MADQAAYNLKSFEEEVISLSSQDYTPWGFTHEDVRLVDPSEVLDDY